MASIEMKNKNDWIDRKVSCERTMYNNNNILMTITAAATTSAVTMTIMIDNTTSSSNYIMEKMIEKLDNNDNKTANDVAG